MAGFGTPAGDDLDLSWVADLDLSWVADIDLGALWSDDLDLSGVDFDLSWALPPFQVCPHCGSLLSMHGGKGNGQE